MKLIIDRFKETNISTIGYAVLIEDNNIVYRFHTLEPAGPDTIQSNQNKRIPIGTYNIKWINSSKAGVDIYGKLPVLFNDNVSINRKILIHIGNTNKDTLGCILVGELNKKDYTLFSSRNCLTNLFNYIYDKEIIIEINDKILHPKS